MSVRVYKPAETAPVVHWYTALFMEYSEKELWQIIDGDCTEVQRAKFLEACQVDADLAARYHDTLYLHELLKHTIKKDKSVSEKINNFKLPGRQYQDRQK